MSDEEDKKCQICKSPYSEAPNEIVICDRCDNGYHQICHKPAIPSTILVPDFPWVCKNCFYSMTKDEKIKFKIFDNNEWDQSQISFSEEDNDSLTRETLDGSNIKSIYLIKNPSSHQSDLSSGELNDNDDESNEFSCKKLSYDLSTLKWDEDHLTNEANVYCYCGNGVEYCRSMLQCINCRQWFHTNCIKSLQSELLIGDQYFKFVCSVCSKDNIEICNRITMKWKVVVGLALSNLTYGSEKRFFNIKNDIIPFLKENEYQFKLSVTLDKLGEEDLVQKIKAELIKNTDKFICKNEDDWALNVDFPYVDPLTYSPWDDNPLSTLAKQKSRTSEVNSLATLVQHYSKDFKKKKVPDGAVRKNSSFFPGSPKKLLNKIKQLDSYKKTIKRPTSAMNSSDHSSLDACSKRTKLKKKIRRHSSHSLLSRFKSNQSNDGSDEKDIPDLDVVIPRPENFEGANNPFYCPTSSLVANNQAMSSIQNNNNSNSNSNSNKLTNSNLTNNSINLPDTPTLMCNLKKPLSPSDPATQYRCIVKTESNKLVLSRVNAINENTFHNSSVNTNLLTNKNGVNKLSNGLSVSDSQQQNEDKKDYKILGKRTQEGVTEYLLEYTNQE